MLEKRGVAQHILYIPYMHNGCVRVRASVCRCVLVRLRAYSQEAIAAIGDWAWRHISLPATVGSCVVLWAGCGIGMVAGVVGMVMADHSGSCRNGCAVLCVGCAAVSAAACRVVEQLDVTRTTTTMRMTRQNRANINTGILPPLQRQPVSTTVW